MGTRITSNVLLLCAGFIALTTCYRSQNLDIQVVNLDEEGKAAIPNPIVTFEEAFEHYRE